MKMMIVPRNEEIRDSGKDVRVDAGDRSTVLEFDRGYGPFNFVRWVPRT